MKTLVEKEESKKPEEEGKDPSGWKNSGEIDTYKLMVLLNNLIRSGKLNLIALNEDVFKNVAYDFDINERDGSISKDDILYKTAKKYLPMSESGKFSAKSPLWVDPNNKHGDHIHIRLSGYSGRIHTDIKPNKWIEVDPNGSIKIERERYVNKIKSDNINIERENKNLKKGEKPKKIKKIRPEGKKDPIKLEQYKGDTNILVLNRGGDNKFSWGLPDMIKVIESLPSDGPWDIGNLSQKGPKGYGADSPFSISHETGANVDIAIPLVGGGSTKKGNWKKFPVGSSAAFKEAKVSEASKEWTGEIEPSDDDRIEQKYQTKRPALLVFGSEHLNPISRIKLYDNWDGKQLMDYKSIRETQDELKEPAPIPMVELSDEEKDKKTTEALYEASDSLRKLSEVYSTDIYFRNAIRNIWIKEDDNSTINYNGIPYTKSERIDVSLDLQNFRRDRFAPVLYLPTQPKHKSYLLQNLIAIDLDEDGKTKKYYNEILSDDYKKGSKINQAHLNENNDYIRGNKMQITSERLAQIIKEEVEVYKASQEAQIDESIDKETLDILKAIVKQTYQELTIPTDVDQVYADTGEPVSKDPEVMKQKAIEFIMAEVEHILDKELEDEVQVDLDEQ